MLNGISNFHGFHGFHGIVKNKAVISSHVSSPTITVESSTQEPLITNYPRWHRLALAQWPGQPHAEGGGEGEQGLLEGKNMY